MRFKFLIVVVTVGLIGFVLFFRGPAELRGRVTAFGRPLVNASISTAYFQGITTDEKGEFSIPATSDQHDIWFTIWPPHGTEQTHTAEFWYWGQVIHDDIDLGSAGVSGLVVEAGLGKPLPAAISLVGGPSSGATCRMTASADGGFLIGPVEPGLYQLTVNMDRYRVWSKPVDLSDGSLLDGGTFQLDPLF